MRLPFYLAASSTLFILLTYLLLISGCGTSSPADESISTPRIIVSDQKKRRASQGSYTQNGVRYTPLPSSQGYRETGIASWYGRAFHGKRTASGEKYNMYAKTAAHKTLPMNTMVRIKNLDNGKEVTARINDRGPFAKRRIIDLSLACAREIGMVKTGTAKVAVYTLNNSTSPQQPVHLRPRAVKKRHYSGSLPRPSQIAQANQAKSTQPALVQEQTQKFYVQVGAYTELAEANREAQHFGNKEEIIIQPYLAAGTNLYRVLVYSGTSREEAQIYAQDLKNHGYRHPIIQTR